MPVGGTEWVCGTAARRLPLLARVRAARGAGRQGSACVPLLLPAHAWHSPLVPVHTAPPPSPPPSLAPVAEVAAKKAALEARREERRKAMAELQARKRMLGNIVFVGQLFK